MAKNQIIIKGAREHNLRNIDVTIPRDKLVVLTGVSGSGKSSLAFDTLFAEGQRRYVESLSSYARQFGSQTAEQMVDRVRQLAPETRFMVLAPVVSSRKGEYKDIFADAKAEGFSRVRVDGEIRDLHDEIKLNKKVKHSIEVVVDRLVMPEQAQAPSPAADEPEPLVGLAER